MVEVEVSQASQSAASDEIQDPTSFCSGILILFSIAMFANVFKHGFFSRSPFVSSPRIQ